MKKLFVLLFPILALLCSCEDASENYRYPSVVTDYVCIVTDKSKQPKTLCLDNGCSYPITLTDEYREAYGQQLPSHKADTVYRVISIFELNADSTAHVYSMAQTISTIPTPLRNTETLHQDPAYLESCWLSGGYLNLVIELKALNGKHSIDFIDTTPETMHGKEFTFYHRTISDIESYRQKLYASIPLMPCKDALQQGDTLRFVINTYDKGITEVEFLL